MGVEPTTAWTTTTIWASSRRHRRCSLLFGALRRPEIRSVTWRLASPRTGLHGACGILAAMSENLDIVRSLRAAWDRGDFSATDWADCEIEYVIVDGPTPRRSKGMAGMAKCWREFLADWQDWQAQTTEVRELDSEQVLALVDLAGRHRA